MGEQLGTKVAVRWPRGLTPWRAFVLAAATVTACAGPAAGDAGFRQEAQDRILAARPGSRVLSIGADENDGLACGWLDLGGRDGVVLVRAERRDGGRIDVYTFGRMRGEPGERASQLYQWAVSKQVCADVLPPQPAGVGVAPVTDQAVAHLWDKDGPEWALVDTTGEGDFVGVSRRAGGGALITPRFGSPDGVETWLRAEGDALAAREQEIGRAAMKRVDACYEQQRGRDQLVRCSDPGLDQDVVLRPARWQLLKEKPGAWAWLLDGASIDVNGNARAARLLGLSAQPRPDPTGDLYDYANMGVQVDCERRQWAEAGGSLHTADGSKTQDMPVTNGETTAPQPVERTLLGSTLFRALCEGDRERTLATWPEQTQAVEAALARIRSPE